MGPIRSARPVDGALLRALNGGIFAYSGAATGEIAPAKDYSHAFLLSNDGDPVPFERVRFRRPPENVYAGTAALRAEAAARGARLGPPPQLFSYGPPPLGAFPAHGISVTLGAFSSASWLWAGTGYVRSEQGSPHLQSGGQQVRATNVVVLRVRVVHSGIRDAAGNEDPFVLAYGQGEALVVRDGLVERGVWRRPQPADPFSFVTATGARLTLAPGPTWIELVPMAGTVSVS